MFEKAFVQDGVDIAEKLLALLAVRFDGGTDLIVADRIDIVEGQIFQLAAKLAHAETVSEGSVDVERLASDGLLTFPAADVPACACCEDDRPV